MKRSTSFLLLILFVGTSCGLLGNGDDGPPGNIVFSAKDGGHHQIFTMREDGSGIRQLTNSDLSSTYPAWSPDGSRIAYARQTPQFSAFTLWVMDADGSNKQPLVTNPRTGSPQLGTRPGWSPDGTKLAFDKCLNCELGGSNYEIFVANLQTGVIDTLTDHPVDDTHPTWSPDGQLIAFESNRNYFDADSQRFRNDLYMINADGSKLQRLTQTGISRNPVWNPTQNIIGYGSNVPSSLGLFQVNVQSKEIIAIKEDFPREVLLVPLAWSSDGQRVFIFSGITSNTGLKNFSLNIIDTESGQSTSLTSDYELVIGADWRKRTKTDN